MGSLEPVSAIVQTSVNRVPARLSASIDCADYMRLGEAVDALIDAGMDAIHVDVMDGRFVPNFGVGMSMLSVLARQRLPLDVHLMVEQPGWLFPRLAALGVRDVTVHVETTARPFHLLQDMRRAALSPGLAFNPATPLAGLADLMPLADRILVMGVDPGFPGQPLVAGIGRRLRHVRRIALSTGNGTSVQVDGGVDWTTLSELWRAGAGSFVVGTRILFSGPGTVGEQAARVRRELARLAGEPVAVAER
ncbi:MAG TPA: ribulose-phosphate 3-epimerase [Candidatus Dormibacteraeota bacterium]|nr:ribulose-phosphate 3-epimerase [Candidatus Dormibacteraeota bacterium]